MSVQFPRTEVAGISLPRMIIGSNWLNGFSHRTTSADNMIKTRYADIEKLKTILETYMEFGINAILSPFNPDDMLSRAVHETEQKLGKKIIMIDSPVLNVDDSESARREAVETIRNSRKNGADFCLPLHWCVEQLVDKNTRTIRRIDDYTNMIRENDMIPGLSAHMPELVTFTDMNGYDIETYIQIYNCMGFMMQVEIENVARVIHNAKKPVITIKSMAAGRCTPYVGLNFSWATIRPCDMIAVGAFTPEEVREDVEISMAAFEHRFPDMGARNSPVKNQAAFGVKEE